MMARNKRRENKRRLQQHHKQQRVHHHQQHPRTMATAKKSSNAFLVAAQLFMFLVILNYYVDVSEATSHRGENFQQQHRESRKLFGGYRITPRFCTPTRSLTRLSSDSDSGPAICMFNHECSRRNGEVVGACMDGFLFGACCRLQGTPGIIRDSVDAGVVMFLDDKLTKRPAQPDSNLPQLNNVLNTYVVRTTDRSHTMPSTDRTNIHIGGHYVENPSTLAVSISHLTSTEKLDDITSNGVAQIASSLLQGGPDIATMMSSSNSENGLFSHSTISHEEADTVLVDNNSSVSGLVPEVKTEPPRITASNRPAYVYQKPIFRPRPTRIPNDDQDKYVLVSAATKPHNQIIRHTTDRNTPIQSIESIMTMLNDSQAAAEPESKLTTIEIQHYSTAPNRYTVTFDDESPSTKRPSTGHYITTAVNEHTTYQLPSTSYIYSPTATKRPAYSSTTSKYPSSTFYNKKPTFIKDTTQSPSDIDNLSSTLSYDDYWGSNSDKTPNKNPSTSYVFSPTPTKRPVSNVHTVVGPSYDVSSGLDTFSSVTPTVIVLSSLDSQYNEDNAHTPSPGKFPDKQATEAAPSNDDNFVEVPLQKPVHQVTINNIITSNNMIHLARPTTEKTPPTVLITPKPNSSGSTTSSSNLPSPARPAVSIIVSDKPNKKPPRRPTTPKPSTLQTWSTVTAGTYTTASYNPIKNEYLTSPDNLINFPPVRNPNLNTTGSNPIFYNNSVSIGVDDVVLQEVEFTTPAFLQEDEDLNKKMSLFVNKIVGSLQGTFQELHDIVILDKVPNATIINANNNKVKPGSIQSDEVTQKPSTTKKPTRRPTRRPTSTTTKKTTTSKKPAKATTASTTTVITTIATTKKPTRAPPTTKKPKPTKSKTTIPPTVTTVVTEAQLSEEESYTTETPDGDHKYLCGVRPMVKSGRIVGGKGATFGEWPWQVLVRESTWLGLFTKNKCGGVLITSRYVTTAAHCQPGFLASLVAVFGKFDISTEAESKRSVSKNVRRVIVHRQYDAATFENDLALLELESPVRYDTHIVPICLPNDEADFTGRMATVTGWGRLKYGGGVPSVLQEVKVPIMENSVCQEMFHTAGHTKVILGSFLCAGYANGQKDSCEGDSGGPLVLQRSDGRWELAGTVSHGIKCAAPYLPGVYMRTTFYKPWLRSITGVN